MPFIKGDILLPANGVARKEMLNGLFHPAVLWNNEYDGTTDFFGIMLTHSLPSKRFQNIPMDASHFEAGFKKGFSKTHFVNQIFLKFQAWGPFIQVGRLTKGGIVFIESKLDLNSGPIDFATYREAILAQT